MACGEVLAFEVVGDSEHGVTLLACGCRGDRLGCLERAQRALPCYAAVCVEVAVVGPPGGAEDSLAHGVVPRGCFRCVLCCGWQVTGDVIEVVEICCCCGLSAVAGEDRGCDGWCCRGVCGLAGPYGACGLCAAAKSLFGFASLGGDGFWDVVAWS